MYLIGMVSCILEISSYVSYRYCLMYLRDIVICNLQVLSHVS